MCSLFIYLHDYLVFGGRTWPYLPVGAAETILSDINGFKGNMTAEEDLSSLWIQKVNLPDVPWLVHCYVGFRK